MWLAQEQHQLMDFFCVKAWVQFLTFIEGKQSSSNGKEQL
jgi:hypothetical protein